MDHEQLEADKHIWLKRLNDFISETDSIIAEYESKAEEQKLIRKGALTLKEQALFDLNDLGKTLTLEEALYEASRHNERIKHLSFLGEEYIYYNTELKQWLTEDGHSIGVNAKYKKNPFFEKGWSIVDMKTSNSEVIEIPI